MKKFLFTAVCLLILSAVFFIGNNQASAASTLSISYPEDGEIYSWDASMKIRWNTVTGASGYYVTILDTESGNYLIRNEYTRNKYFTATSYLPETPTTLKIWVGAVTSSSQTGAEAFTHEIIYIGLSHEPGITNGASDNITKTGARLKMSVDKDHGQAITDCGFYIGTTSDEDLMDKYSFKRYSTSQGATTKGTKYMTVSGLEPGTKYYYKAYAVNAAGEEISSAKSFTTEKSALANPVITYPIDGDTYTANNSIKLQWKSVSGVDGYRYYIKQLSGEPDRTNEQEPSVDDWSDTVSASRTYYTLSASNVKGGYWYKFVVEAYADGMTSGWSDWCYVKVENGTMAAPHITYPEPDSTIIGYQDIPFSWNQVSGAEEYTYFVKRLSGAPSYTDENEPSLKSWSKPVSASTTHFTLDETEAVPGYWYKFVVKASAEGMNASWSEWVYCYLDEFRLTDPVLTAPANQTVVNHAESIHLSWSPVSGVDGYNYHIKQLSGSPDPENENEDSVCFWSEPLSPSASSYTFPGSKVKGGYWYKFVIEAYSSKAESSWSNWSYVYVNTAPLDAAKIVFPENTQTYPGNQNIVLDWESVDFADGYTFHIKRLSGLPDRTNEDEPCLNKWSDPTGKDTTSYTLTSDKFIPGYWYKFVIEAYADGMIPSWSEWVYCYASEPTLTDPYIHTPACWSETSEGTSITVDWDSVENAVGYRMHYKQLLGKPDTGNDNELAVSGDKVELGNKTSFTLPAGEVIGGYWYKFVVEAYASSNASTWSNWVYVYVGDNGSLASPVITSPKPNAIYNVGDEILFTWSKVENAENYTYYIKQLSGEPDYSDNEKADALFSKTTSASERYFTLTAENIHENTWYKFVVEAKAPGYDSGWSKYLYIRIPECEDWIDYVFPGSLVQVSAHAFGNNLLLRTFDASKSQLEVIGQKAFANCVHLQSVFLPESVYSIDEDAFENCPNLTIHCISGSHAEEFALRKGIRVEAHGKTIESDTVQLSRNEWNIPDNDKAEAAVRVNSSSAWTASSDSGWLTLSKSSGNDGANVILTADKNTSSQSRHATVTFTCGQATASLRVSQNAFSVKECEMKLHPDYWEPSENALTREIVVQNTHNFTVSSNRNWLTYTVSNASIIAKVSPDALSGQNTGILTVTCSDCGAVQTVSVSTKGIIVPTPASVTVLSTEPHAVFVSWSPVAGASYIVERSNDEGSSWTQMASVNTNRFTDDSEVYASTAYKYRITATKTVSGVTYSSTPIISASCTTPKEQTISFTGVINSIGDNGRAKIEALSSISWNTISGMTYKLSLKDLTSDSYVNSLNQTNVGAVNSYSLSGLLTEGHQYRVWVGAYNTAGRRVGQSGERVFTVIKPTTEPKPVINVLSVTPTTVTNSGSRSFVISISASHARTFKFEFGSLKVWEKYDKDNSKEFGYSNEWPFDGADSFGSDWTYQLMKKRDVGFYPEANAPEGTYTITITAYGDGGEATTTAQVKISGAVYNSNTAVEYALQYNGSHPGSSYNSEYTTQSSDCVNFVSQCLSAGGIPHSEGVWEPYTSAWIGTGPFIRHFANTLGYSTYVRNNVDNINELKVTNPAGSSILSTYLQSGDIIFCNGSKPEEPGYEYGHAMIVTRVVGNTIYYCGHSNNRCGCTSCNDSISLSKINVIVCMQGNTVSLPPASVSLTKASMLKNLNASSYFGGKKEACVLLAELLWDNGFSPTFIAGVLANICAEGEIGKFENIMGYTQARLLEVYPKLKPVSTSGVQHTNYIAHMKGFTDYDACTHNHAEYSQYSNKYIYNNISLSDVDVLLAKYSSENWHAKFGLGTVQWTADRAVKLMTFYHAEAGSSDTITYSQCLTAEMKCALSELLGSKYWVFSNWFNENANSLDTPEAAYNAGFRVCRDYESPGEVAQYSIRGDSAKKIYAIISGN